MVSLIFVIAGVAICGLSVWFWRKQSSCDDTPEYEGSGGSSVLDDRRIQDGGNHFHRPTVRIIQDDEVPPWEIASSLPLNRSLRDSLYLTPLYENGDAEFRREMEVCLVKAQLPIPTISQWSMILSPDRVTRVVAGAGSGKSSGLSLRVVFLHKFIGIPLNQITVVTFTRRSRADMVNKLIRDMGAFEVALSESAAKRIVRTFHSMIISQANGMGEQCSYFEQIGDNSEGSDNSDNLGSLNTKQLDHLRKIYADTYHTSKTFNRAIGQVLLEKIAAPRLVQYEDVEGLDRAMLVAEPRDRIIAQAITDAWLAKEGFDPKIRVIEWGVTAIKTSRVGGVWYANGRVISTGMPIMLGCGGIKTAMNSTLDLARYPIKDTDKGRALGFMANVRAKVIATIATEKYIYIETDEDLSDFYTLIDWVYRGNIPGDRETFPAFSVRVPGDTSSVSIFEAIYNIGTFIASMGADVSSTAKVIADQMAKENNQIEANLCRALVEFWPALHQDGNSTYDELFLKHADPLYADSLPKEELLPMKYLHIDEFQDISGQIVQWIKSVHSALARHGEDPSLFAVGDDFQSVYGWRGSDPGFMIDFDRHFGESKLVVMNENFRSGQNIINKAEKILAGMDRSAIKKHGVSSGHASDIIGDVNLCSGSDEELALLVTRLASEDPKPSIFILSRTNDGLTPFRDLAKKKLVSLLTMHRAKGLEADYVFIKGDCNYTVSSPLRNAIYSFSGMPTSYDKAQQDESLRLAYVAMTRGRKKVYWFGDNVKPGGAFNLLGTV